MNCMISMMPTLTLIFLSSAEDVSGDAPEPRVILKTDRKTVYRVAFTPDGKTLIAAIDRKFTILDVATGKQLKVLEDDQGYSSCFTLSPDGKTLTTLCQNKTMKLLNTQTWKVRAILHEHAKFESGGLASNGSRSVPVISTSDPCRLTGSLAFCTGSKALPRVPPRHGD